MALLVGYVAIVIAVLGLGTNMVPLKGVEIGDGIFYQFCMCCAAFTTSIPILIFQVNQTYSASTTFVCFTSQ